MANVLIPVVVTGEAGIKKLKRDLEQVGIKGSTAFKKVSKSAAKAKIQTNSLKKSVQTVSTALGPLGLAGGIAGVTFAVLKMTKSMVSFETAMAEVSTLIDTTTTDMGKLTDATLELSTRVPRSAIDISRGLYQTISAGVTDAGEAMQFLEVATRAAVGGLTDTNTAVKALTTIINAYGKDVSEAADVSDTFFQIIKLGVTKFEPLSAAVGIVASSAALAGITFEELGAAFGTVTKFGIDTQTTATSLNRLFLSLANPTTQLKDKSRELGLEFSAAALRAKGFAPFIAELTAAFEKDEDAIFELGLDMRAFRSLAILGGVGAEEFGRQLAGMAEKADVAEVAFEKLNRTTGAQFQLLKNQFNAEVERTGGKLLPLATIAMKGFSQAVTFWLFPGREFAKTVKEVNNEIDDLNDKIGKAEFRSPIGPELLLPIPKAPPLPETLVPESEELVAVNVELLDLYNAEAFALEQFANRLTDVNQFLREQFLGLNNVVGKAVEFKDAAIDGEIALEDAAFKADALANNVSRAADAMARLISDARSGGISISGILGALSVIPGPQQPFVAGGATIAGAFGFEHGGTVPGPRGAPQLAVVHGGETITPPGQTINNNPTLNVTINGGNLNDDFEFRRFVNRLNKAVQDNDVFMIASDTV